MKRAYSICGLGAGAVIALAVAAAGCGEDTNPMTANKGKAVANLILHGSKIKPEHPLAADFDGKVKLLGYDLEPETVAPGESFTVTWYWSCVQAPGPGYKLFTHMVDAKGKSRVNRDSVGPIRKNFQPEHWTPGIVVKDPQQIAVPKSWSGSVVELRVGLFGRKGRLNVTSGPEDGQGRVRGARVSVGAKRVVAPAAIPRAPSAPVIDGAFEDEAAWSGALSLEPFANTLTGEKAPRQTAVRVMWDDAALYVAMRADDDYLQSKYTQRDEELWHEDAFEMFLDPLGDKTDYYEIQVSPAGVVFDSHLAAYRKNDNAWNGEIAAAAKIDGTSNDGKGDDKGWTAEVAIPWKSLDKSAGVPPGDAKGLKVNFFRVDVKADGKTDYSAWSPPLRGDFHALDKFREIALVPAAPASAAPEAAAPQAEERLAPAAKKAP
jgi:hypothetical protein